VAAPGLGPGPRLRPRAPVEQAPQPPALTTGRDGLGSMRTAPRIGSGLVGWRRLAVVAALANTVVLFGYGVARGDREALAFAVVMLVGLGLLRVGKGLLGLLVLAALFVNIEFWMFPAANGNATYRVGPVDLLVPGSLVAFSLAGFIGAVAAIVHLHDPGAGRAAAGPTGIVAVVFVVASLGLVWAMTDAAPQVAPEGRSRSRRSTSPSSPRRSRRPAAR
jgi:uncharacterized membrane protein YqjE